MTYSEFRRELAARTATAGRLLSYNVSGGGRGFGKSRVTVDIDIVTSRGERGEVQAHMQKEDGRWRWCGWTSTGGSSLRWAPLL